MQVFAELFLKIGCIECVFLNDLVRTNSFVSTCVYVFYIHICM